MTSLPQEWLKEYITGGCNTCTLEIYLMSKKYRTQSYLQLYRGGTHSSKRNYWLQLSLFKGCLLKTTYSVPRGWLLEGRKAVLTVVCMSSISNCSSTSRCCFSSRSLFVAVRLFCNCCSSWCSLSSSS